MLADKYTFGVPGFVVPLGLDSDEYFFNSTKGKLFSRFPELSGKKIILFLGRINFKKGLDILVNAFAAIAREQDDVHLLIAGPDDTGYGKKVSGWLKKKKVNRKQRSPACCKGKKSLRHYISPRYSSSHRIPKISGLRFLKQWLLELPVIVSDKVNLWPEVVAAKAGEVAPCDANGFSRKIYNILE